MFKIWSYVKQYWWTALLVVVIVVFFILSRKRGSDTGKLPDPIVEGLRDKVRDTKTERDMKVLRIEVEEEKEIQKIDEIEKEPDSRKRREKLAALVNARRESERTTS